MSVQQPLQWVKSLMEEIQSFDGSARGKARGEWRKRK